MIGRVIARSPTVWHSSVSIDVGSGDGVHVDDPVISGDGVVGRIASVEPGSSQVMLLTDHESAISAKVLPAGVQGVVKPEVGNPEDLILDFIDSTKRVHGGLAVVTSGWRAQGLASLFPPGLPLGEVTKASIVEQEAKEQVQVRPYADLRNLDLVQVLTGGLARMILTPKIVARIVAICMLGVLLQLSFFSRVELFHVSPDVLPALVVCLGLLGGSLTGAVSGFSIGFFLDCLLVEALGISSLVLLGIGYLAGLFRERFEIHSSLVPALLCMGLTMLAELGFGLIQLLLGLDAPLSTLIIRDLLLKSVYAFFLGWPIYLGMRRVLRPALVDEPKVQRRRQPTVLGA